MRRLGRRFIRFLGWCIAASASLVGVVLLVFAAYVVLFDYPETLREQLEAELSRLTGAPARIGSIDLYFPQYAFEMRDVEVGGPNGELALEVARVWGQLRLSELVRLRLHWTELRVQGLRLRLTAPLEEGDGKDRAPPRVRLPLSRASVAAERVVLENATIVYSNREIPWELEAENVSLVLTRDGQRSYEGTLDYERGRFVIPERLTVTTGVTAEFELASGELLLHALEVSSDLGQVSAKGKMGLVGGGLRARFEVTAESALDRLEVALAAPGAPSRGGVAEGRVSFDGNASVTPEGYEIRGRVELPRGRLFGLRLSSWSGDIFWDPRLVQLSLAQGRVGAGRGRLQIQQALPVADNPVLLDARIEGVPLSDLVEGIRGRPAPVASSVSAMVSLSFPADDPLAANGRFEVEGSRLPDAPSGIEPAAFQVTGRLVSGDVGLDEGHFETDSIEALWHGVYPRSAPAEIDVDVRANDLARTDRLALAVRRLVRPEAEPDPAPWGIAGRGRASGRLTGRFPHPVFEGTLSAEELAYGGLAVGRVEARGRLSRETLRFEDLLAEKDDGVLAGSGFVLLRGPFGARDFELSLRASRWPARDLTAWLDTDARASGSLSGKITLSRHENALRGQAGLVVSEPSLLGERFDRASVDASFRGREVALERLTLERDDQTLSGAITVDLDTGSLDGAFQTRGFPLAPNETMGIELGGVLDLDVRVSGRLRAPTLELRGKGRRLELSGVELGDGSISATWRANDVWADVSLGERLQLDARARLEGAIPVTGTLRFEAMDASPWIARLSEALPPSVKILVSGGARFRFELNHPASLSAEAELASVSVRAGSFRADTRAPASLRLEDGILRLPAIGLAAEGSRMSVSGLVNLRERSLDVRAEGATALAFLESFYPSVDATGEVDVSARITGTWDAPSLSGYADLGGVAVRFGGFRQPLGDLRGRLVFDNRTIRIPDCRGVFGSGPVSFSGAIVLDGFEPASIDLRAQGTGMRLRYPEGLTALLDADLSLLGDRAAQVVSGRVTLKDAVWSREYDLVAGILSDRQGFELFEEFEDNELLRNVHFDVRIVAPKSLRLRNSIAEIDASGELELRGTVRDPVLLGSTVAERGEVYLLGQRYDIVSGKVDFVDPTKVEPFIELTAETRVRSYRVELRLTGTTERFYPELSSDPPLRTIDILRLLSGASEQDFGLLGNEEEELAGVGVASLLTERLTQVVGSRAERLFGLDRVSIDPFLIGQFTNPTARISLGKQITRDLTINYSSNLSSTTEAIILIEYTPEGNMSWILSRDEEGDVGIDVKFRKSF